ncbi:MAG: hypothetical protein OJF50_006546 [Nitrospira sp.]|nr:hypothetical protein [Nitrospira sp.]
MVRGFRGDALGYGRMEIVWEGQSVRIKTGVYRTWRRKLSYRATERTTGDPVAKSQHPIA